MTPDDNARHIVHRMAEMHRSPFQEGFDVFPVLIRKL